MRNSVESGQVSYIFPLENHQSSHPWACNWLSSWTKKCSETERGGHATKYRRTCLALIISLVVTICSLFWAHHVLTGTGFGMGSGSWDNVRMEKLQSDLLTKVRSLMELANRSIHDHEVRQELRNLSREDPKTCYTPNCLHTGMSAINWYKFIFLGWMTNLTFTPQGFLFWNLWIFLWIRVITFMTLLAGVGLTYWEISPVLDFLIRTSLQKLMKMLFELHKVRKRYVMNGESKIYWFVFL